MSHFSASKLRIFAMAALLISAASVTASAAPASISGRTLAPDTRFFIPIPAQGSIQQIVQLATHGNIKGALLLTAMEATSQAVWFTGSAQAGVQQTPAQVENLVRETVSEAALFRTIPVLVAYNIPGRDCAQFSAGGALTDAAYQAWISGFAAGLGRQKAVVILEPDALANLPSYCSVFGTATYPFTDAGRLADINYAVTALEADPNVSVYLDGGHSAWQSVGTISLTLVQAGVANAQGFFLDVSNYQYAQNNVAFGTWVADCIALGAGSLSYDYADNCPNQYWNGGPAGTEIATLAGAFVGVALSPYGVWSDATTTADLNTSGIDARYASMLGSTVASTHFVIDTSRNGQGPNNMQLYEGAPYDQPTSVIGTLETGNWCNPPASGLGLRPTANTSSVSPLLDAYLWVKTPGQSDGQCDMAGGVRNWDNSAYTPPISGWPLASSTLFTQFDPLWSLQVGAVLTDPAAGAWFPQQALGLAQLANPALTLP
ncbi:MAG TPA: glycoside hydrolase family 6 protein [Steroidobacteraceae bacterium]